MRARPWPLIILAILQFLSPVATVLFNAWFLGVKPIYVLQWILEKPPLQVFEMLGLMPLAGFAIYRMKTWSYGVFFGAMGWSLYSNLKNLNYATSTFSPALVVLLYAVPVGLVIYFMIPAVRRTYLDPRVRWWEAKRRYLLDTPLDLRGEGGPFKGRLENISEGGAFFLLEGPGLRNGLELQVRFHVLTEEFQVPGIVMYALQRPGAASAYGIRFNHTPQTQKRVARLVKGLSLIGLPHRDMEVANSPWYLALRDWGLTLLRTGRGLLPEVHSPRKDRKI